ncbi:MAG: hypothetical protein HYY02_12650 [Chloroflexi bacterium]|nr:hypothetical protein [Chloroflexota bacterium]
MGTVRLAKDPEQRGDAPPAGATPSGMRGLWTPLILLLTYALLAATYFVVRSWGQWAETDSALQALAVRSMAQSADLVPSTGQVYPHGYAHGVITNALLAFTGIDFSFLLQAVFPLVSVLLVFPAWALYRELSGSRSTATLATLLLFLQPEFLFVILRGSHERELRLFMLVSLWLLVRSFRFRERPGRFAVYAGLFYLTSYALIATNALFGISFVVAIATAMGAAWAVGRLWAGLWALGSDAAARLATVSLAVVCLGFIFVFFLYPPARHGLEAFELLQQRVAALYLTTQTDVGVNPYLYLVEGWISLPVYFLVSIEDYLLIAASAAVWLWLGWRWVIRGDRQPQTLAQWLLWLLYGAFALQGGLAILSDRTELLGGNLQHRSFPSFAMVATPLVAGAITQWRPGRLGGLVARFSLAALAGLALLKATNEPILSNKWTFYTALELQALRWADQRHQSESVWVGLDERLKTAYAIAVGESTRHNTWDVYRPKPQTRAFLVTDVIRSQSSRLGEPLPPTAGENRVYDSGTAQLYRLRAQTPYQR